MNNSQVAARNSRTKCHGNKRQTLPKLRSKLVQLVVGLVAAIFIVVSIMTAQTNQRFIDLFIILASLLLPLIFLLELVFRICYIVEEYQHILTRYENSILTLFKDIFYFSSRGWILAVISFFICMGTSVKYDQYIWELWWNLGPISAFLSIAGFFLLSRVINLQCGPLYDSLWIETNSLDYGSGMAHSFFFGYLKLIFPKKGTFEKNFEELMQDYESTHNVQLAFYKLFILIPKSLYCFTSLMDTEFSPSIEESSSLASQTMTVAGVRNRKYKNSVYKIKKSSGERIYVAAEYATPLKTFRDVVTHNGEFSNQYKKHKNDIVLQFYLTLKKVLKENEDCTNYCELIFYDDKDENDRYKDVGQVLLRRISKLKRMAQERPQ